MTGVYVSVALVPLEKSTSVAPPHVMYKLISNCTFSLMHCINFLKCDNFV